MNRKHEQLVRVLETARDFLQRPDNDFSWSSWGDGATAVREIDQLLGSILAGELPNRADIGVLFAPTGPIQEVSVSSGWGDEFLDLANRYDSAANRSYGWRR